jgi:putative oxidoreductase
MKRHVPTVAGILLGLAFLGAGLTYFLGPEPPAPPEGTVMAAFFTSFMGTGWATFVKVFELLGGVLVAIPRTRNLGLLALGPIIVNIVAFHALVMEGVGLFSPMIAGICALALYLLWVERAAFANLVTRPLGGGTPARRGAADGGETIGLDG